MRPPCHAVGSRFLLKNIQFCIPDAAADHFDIPADFEPFPESLLRVTDGEFGERARAYRQV